MAPRTTRKKSDSKITKPETTRKKSDSKITKPETTTKKPKQLSDSINKDKTNNDEVIKPVPSKPPKLPVNEDGHRYWLIKSEPVNRIQKGQDISFSLESLMKVESEPWNGVRNYEARNNLLAMVEGDLCLFYHSNCKVPGIVGVAKVYNQAVPDEGQFIPEDPYYDPKSTKEKPKWWCPRVSFHRRFRRKVSLQELRSASTESEPLRDFMLVTRGRLSVIPVGKHEFEEIIKLEQNGSISDDIDCDISRDFITAK
ncbi:hypothetical protein DASC09_007650 [Saccharomycopsis crataegensis]|uniref:Thymocyte nuclear protein 1 n=1 Tax=Saccharomycopsis crataegensis TaxID=43959 RepID=A0AAV5QGB2_9ASCO|nr:hypothetical protein DASC09_007650 [Saccharomycopsis crataegensis]